VKITIGKSLTPNRKQSFISNKHNKMTNDILTKLIKNHGISTDGANFLRKSVDPFHDFEVRLEGLPDSYSGNTVVQEITKSVSITADPSYTGNWDCHIAIMPELLNTAATGLYASNLATFFGSVSATGSVSNIIPTAQNSAAMGPFLISKCPTGSLTFPQTSSNPTAALLSAPSFVEYFDGVKRLIGIGFEVANTTAELYRSGSVATYKMPQTVEYNSYVNTVPTIAGTTPTLFIESRSPPASLSEAVLLPNSRQWEASRGAYVVGHMDVDECKMRQDVSANRIFTNGDYSSVAHTCIVTSATANYANSCFSKPTSFDTSGAYFTGLSTQTVLTLTMRIIVESAPTSTNSQLVVLATPSPAYDPKAIMLYKDIVVSMPSGVPLSENDGGEYWRKACSILSATISGFGSEILKSVVVPYVRNVVDGISKDRNQVLVVQNKEAMHVGATRTDRNNHGKQNGQTKQNASGGRKKQQRKKQLPANSNGKNRHREYDE